MQEGAGREAAARPARVLMKQGKERRRLRSRRAGGAPDSVNLKSGSRTEAWALRQDEAAEVVAAVVIIQGDLQQRPDLARRA